MSDDPVLPVGDEGMRPAEPIGHVVGASDQNPAVAADDPYGSPQAGRSQAPSPPRAPAPATPPRRGDLSARRSTWMNWVSLVMGLLALPMCVFALPAIVLGHLGVAAARRGAASAKAAGVVGLVLGYAWFVAFAVASVYSAATGKTVSFSF